MTDVENSDELQRERTYQIGTVSSLTGIDAHTIRAWERRYGAIKPMRSDSGRRLYSDETVERLQLLKGLVDCSEAISKIAALPDDELRKRLAKLAEHEGQAALLSGALGSDAHRPRLALLAPALPAQISANSVAMSDFDVLVTASDEAELLDALERKTCEIIILEADRIGSGGAALTQRCKNLPSKPQVIVLYRFASRGELARLARAGAALVRTPIRLESLRRVILDQAVIGRARNLRSSALPPTGPLADPAAAKTSDRNSGNASPPPRRFDDAQLARLLEISSAVDCECPNHLSSLISGLVAFEVYSRDCESRNEADADQHRRLAEGTAEARALMEDILVELCAHEGISV